MILTQILEALQSSRTRRRRRKQRSICQPQLRTLRFENLEDRLVLSAVSVADAGGPYEINEGEFLTLDASASVQAGGETFSFSWDLNGDGDYGDASGVSPTVSWAQLTALGISDGPGVFTVGVTLDDGVGGSDEAFATLSVYNVAPVITGLSVDSTVIHEDGSVTLSGSFTDAGNQDTHLVSIDWGTGEPSSAAVVTEADGSGTFTATHQYKDDNPTATSWDDYTITVTVTDDDARHNLLFGTATASTTIRVNNVAPVANIFTEVNSFDAIGDHPSGLTFDGTHLFVSNQSGVRTIFVLETDGTLVHSFAAPSTDSGAAGAFDGRSNPNALTFDGNHLFVANLAGTVFEIDTAGTTIYNTFSLPYRPGGMAYDGTNLFISDWDSRNISVFTTEGTFVREFVAPYRSAGLTFHDGHLFNIDIFSQTIAEFTTDGTLVRTSQGPHKNVDGLGGVTFAGSNMFIAEISDPDRFVPPVLPGSIIELATAANVTLDWTVNDGNQVSLIGTFVDPGSEDTHTYLWQVSDSDGQLIADGTSQNFSFTPPSDGAYTVTYTVTDDDEGVGTDTVVVSVNNANPVITSSDSLFVAENQTAVLTVTASDANLPAQTLTFSITGGVDAAKFVVNAATGDLAFSTAPDFEHPGDADTENVYKVRVTVDDGNGGTDAQLISVMVTDANEAPVITSSSTPSVSENQTVVLTVTATDEDLPTDTITYSLSSGADQSKFSINATTGELTFIVAPDFEAPSDVDTNNVYEVGVSAHDGDGGLDEQLIRVTVDNVDSAFESQPGVAPVAGDDSYFIDANTVLTVDENGVLFNDVGPVGDSLTAALVAGPAHGELTFKADGSFTYTAGAGFYGTDTFTYIAEGDQLESNLATATLTVARDLGEIHVVELPNLNPTEGDIWYGFRATRDALINLWAQNSDDVTITLYDENRNELDEWTPGNGHQRLEWPAEQGQKFYFRLSGPDDDVNVHLANVIKVDAPTAHNDSFTVDKDAVLTITAGTGLLTNDVANTGDPVTVALVSGPSHGNLVLNADGSFEYSAQGDYHGTDQFTYRLSVAGESNTTATVNIELVQVAPSVKVVEHDGANYVLDSAGWLSINGQDVWGGTQDFSFGNDGSLYWLNTDGLLEHRTENGWETLGEDVEKYVVHGGSIVYSLDTDNWLSINGRNVWAGTEDFSFGDDGSLNWQSTNGLLQRSSVQGWATFGEDIEKYVVHDSSTVYSLHTDDWLSINGRNVWGGTQDFSFGDDGSLYWQSTNGLLQRRYGGTWETIDNDVVEFQVRRIGGVWYQRTDAALARSDYFASLSDEFDSQVDTATEESVTLVHTDTIGETDQFFLGLGDEPAQ